MSEKSPVRGTRTDSKSAFLRLGRHLYWILPFAAATVAVAVVLILHSNSAADIAGALALPVAATGAIAAILAIPGFLSGGRSAVKQKRTPNARISIPLVLLMVILAAVGSGVTAEFATSRNADDAFLAGDLKIGIAGEVPGWSAKTGDSRGLNGYSGFEIDLVNFLRQKYGFKPTLIPLAPAEQHGSLLRGDVDLVVANFEMTTSRNDSVYFAGPYFTDRYGLYVSRKKAPLPDANLVLCRARGLGHDPKFEKLDTQPTDIEFEGSNQSCVTRFLDSRDRVNSLAMNQSILSSLLMSRNFDAKDLKLRELGEMISYGIGFRREHSAACRDVAADLGQWLNKGWTNSVRDNLPFLMENPNTLHDLGYDQRPFYVNTATCGH